MTDMRSHWDKVYSLKPPEELGWYEEHPQPSITLIQKCRLVADSPILVAGAGTSTLIRYLANEGFKKIIATDISEVAINKLKERLGKEQADKVTWIADDLTRPEKLRELDGIALWFDRAVLHFFTVQEQHDEYFRLLKHLVRPGGYVIIAAFSLTGAKKCSGLDVKNYNAGMLADCLGREFTLVEAFEYVHIMPSGDKRDYIYTLFQRDL